MISLVQKGKYTLLLTLEQIKLLVLEKKFFAWIKTEGGDMLSITTKKRGDAHKIIQSGNYRIYSVSHEKAFVDGIYIELFVGEGKWDGYILPKGLPNKKHTSVPLQAVKNTVTRTTHVLSSQEALSLA